MKRICACLLCLLILLGAAERRCALAEKPIFEIPAAVAALYGRQVKISYFRVRESENGELAVLDPEGNQLAAAKVDYRMKQGTISFAADGGFPAGQTLRIVFRSGGAETLQQECLLALYDAGRQGIRRIDIPEKKIAVTFDSSGGPGRTLNLLKLLEKHQARCTFFLEGGFALGHPDLTAAIAAAGHEIASHSLYYTDMRTAEDEVIYNGIVKAKEAIEAASGQPVTLFRPPAGYTTYRDRAIAHALGCETILWTFDSLDGFAERTEYEILKRLLTRSEPGAIILMHIYGQYTLEALEKYLPVMREQGYEFVTVSGLMQCAKPEADQSADPP